MQEHSVQEVKGVQYRMGRLTPRQQLHVTRRLAPVLTALASLLGHSKDGEAALLAASKPFAEALAGLPDADVDYVVGNCLSVVSRSMDGKAWTPLYAPDCKTCLADDLGLEVFLPLITNVIRANLGPSIAEFLTSPPAAGPSA